MLVFPLTPPPPPLRGPFGTAATQEEVKALKVGHKEIAVLGHFCAEVLLSYFNNAKHRAPEEL